MIATCKLGTKGCWNDGKCRAVSNCTEKVVTNADRIRAMSDEELAEDYCKFLNAILGKVGFELKMEEAKAIILKNLQEPAEGE